MHTLLFLALVPSAPAPPEKEKEVPKELKPLQGVWKITAVEQGGRTPGTFGPAVGDRFPLVIVGDAYVLNNQAGTLKVDLEKKTADLTITEGRYKGQVLPALFEISDNTLKLAFPTPGRTTRATPAAPLERPKELKSDVGSRVTLYTFERDAKATKEQAAANLKEQKERIITQTNNPFGPSSSATAVSNEALLKQIIERLDRIEKRLDEMEKKQAKPDKK
jgi:uncharacterized protein (TIGR03067 family)